MSARIFLEGGGESTQLKNRCREGFRNLLGKCGFSGRMPRLVASGARESAFEDFETAHADPNSSEFVAMLIDSEDPIADIERPWSHLRQRDGWAKPASASHDQVLFMTTCMETWIAADREALTEAYARRGINENALPPLDALENRSRQDVLNRLKNATNNQFDKGEESFKALGRLNPATIEPHLPSFARVRRILNEKLV